ncbi:phosphatidylinositol-binding clathrin assembly protein-like, partial [Exaiptasia diaphana]|uniref:Uncharacterized protein n=1 Tax=Exaiptasia diaphana TaxID=2652724 RepID=A0A913YLR3_EXADI
LLTDNLSLHNGGTTTKTTKSQHQWTPAQPQVKTGGPNWQKQNLPARSTVPSAQMGWGSGSISPQQPGMYRPPFGQPVGQPPAGQPMGGQPPMFPGGFAAGQPQQQPADPFGPIPGSQVSEKFKNHNQPLYLTSQSAILVARIVFHRFNLYRKTLELLLSGHLRKRTFDPRDRNLVSESP